MNRPPARQNQRENCVDGGRFDDWDECLIVVNSRTLSEATKNPLCFVAIETAIRGEFVSKNPLAYNHIHTRWTWYEIPSVFGLQGSKLVFHGCTPVWICESISKGLGHRKKNIGMHQLGLLVAEFPVCEHVMRVANRSHRHSWEWDDCGPGCYIEHQSRGR